MERYIDHPFGDEQTFLAMQVATIINSNPFREKGSKAFDFRELMPKRATPRETAEEVQAAEAQKEMAKVIVNAMGGVFGD